MFDKLEMRTQQSLNIKEIERLFPLKHTLRMSSSAYRRLLYIFDSNRHVKMTIETDPIWTNVAPTKIYTNPTKWDSFKELKNFLTLFCNTDLLEITRIDHAVDIEISIEKLFQCTRIKNKKQTDTYTEHCSIRGSFLTGFYLGTKPELYCIYDKAYQLSSRNKLHRIKNVESGILSRIELRQFKKKVKYKRLNELINYLSDGPFQNIEFYEVKEDSRKAEALQTLTSIDGLQRTIAQLSRHKNFNRNQGKNFIGVGLEDIIRGDYEENLRHFFKRTV